MPVFRVRAPNGSVYDVPVQDGGTLDDAIARLDGQLRSAGLNPDKPFDDAQEAKSREARTFVEDSNKAAQIARWAPRAAGGLMSTFGTAIDAIQPDAAGDVTGQAAAVRDGWMSHVPGAETVANLSNRAAEVKNNLMAGAGHMAAAGVDWLGDKAGINQAGAALHSGAANLRGSADARLDENIQARKLENERRAAAGEMSLEQETERQAGTLIGQRGFGDAGRAVVDASTSDESRANAADFGNAWKGGIKAGLKFTAQNMGTAADVVAPSLIESLAPASVAGRMVKGGLMASAASEAEAAGARAVAAGLSDTEVTRKVTEALVSGTVRAEKATMSASLGTQTAQVSEMSARQQAEAIRTAPVEELRKNPTFVEMEAQLGTESARMALTQRVFDITMGAALPINALTTILPGKAGLQPVEARLAGIEQHGFGAAMTGIKGRAVRGVVHGAKEFAGETLQGGGDQLAQNIGGVPSGTAPSYWDQVGTQAVLEGTVGFGAGGVTGMLTGPHAPAARQGEALADRFIAAASSGRSSDPLQATEPPVGPAPAGPTMAPTVAPVASPAMQATPSLADEAASLLSARLDRARAEGRSARSDEETELERALTAVTGSIYSAYDAARAFAWANANGRPDIAEAARARAEKELADAQASHEKFNNKATEKVLARAQEALESFRSQAGIPAPAAPASARAAPTLADVGLDLSNPVDPLEQQLAAAGAAPVLAPRVPVAPVAPQQQADPSVTMVRAGDLAEFAVHSADTNGSEIGDERMAANAALRDSITQNGINQPLTLRVDTDRGLAHIADGNHRTVMAASINPDMMIPVRIVRTSGNKRALPTAKPYSGQFDPADAAAPVEQPDVQTAPGTRQSRASTAANLRVAAKEMPAGVTVAADKGGFAYSNPAGDKIKTWDGPALSPADQVTEAKAAAQVLQDPAAAVAAYRALPETDGGRVINTDDAREIFPAYSANAEGRTKNALAVHEPASWVAKRVWQEALAQPVAEGKDPNVMFMAGGTGAGKTTVIKRMGAEVNASRESADIIFDGNLSGTPTSIQKINDALASGRSVDVVYIARDPVEAFEYGAIPRANKETYGRTVPIHAHLGTHLGSAKTFGDLVAHFAGDPRVTFKAYLNQTDAPPVQIAPEQVAAIATMDYNGLEEKLNQRLEVARNEGRVSDRVWNYYRPDGVQAVPTASNDGSRESRASKGDAATASEGQGNRRDGDAQPVAGNEGSTRQAQVLTPELKAHAQRLQVAITAHETLANKGKAVAAGTRVFHTVQEALDAGFDVADDQDGFYDEATGVAGVIAENVSGPDAALLVAWHERNHRGILKMFPNTRALSAEMARAGTNPIVNAVAKAIHAKRGYDKLVSAGKLSAFDARSLSVEEALAELNGALQTDNWSPMTRRYGVDANAITKKSIADVMRRMLRALRTAITGNGGKSSAYSNADVMSLLKKSHKVGLATGTVAAVDSGRVRQETAGSPNGESNGQQGQAATRPELGGRDGRASVDSRGSDQAPASDPLRGAPKEPGATGPDPKLNAVAEQFARDAGIDLRRQAEYAKVDVERAARIAEAYEQMEHAPQDPKVKAAYADLIKQTTAQYKALEKAGFKFWLMDPANDPYNGNPWNAMRDLRSTQTMAVFPTDAGFGSGDTNLDVSDNPLLADTGIKWPYGSPDGELRPVMANDLFRAVHDAFGHGIEGAGFRARGEENAWQAHARLFTGPALGALTSETRGQNSSLNYGKNGEHNRTASVDDTIFADQKTGLMPEWTWAEGRVGDSAATRASTAPKRTSEEIMGKAASDLTPSERAVRRDVAQRFVDILSKLPKAAEMASVALAGKAKRGWYRESAEAITSVFGHDGPRFAALLAAMSPQTSVEANLTNALTTWKNWVAAGKPTDRAGIVAVLGQSVQGNKGEDSILDAWINNSVRALSSTDVANLVISGPKVNSFYQNLIGNVDEVTNDAWIANYALVDQTIFSGSLRGDNPGKGAGYLAMSARTRQTAKALTRLTGERWTPAEVQETVWSWAKTVFETAREQGVNAVDLVATNAITDDLIASTPAFGDLFNEPQYRSILESAGLRVGRDGPTEVARAGGQAEAVAPEARHLQTAAKRLDRLRDQRAADASERAGRPDAARYRRPRVADASPVQGKGWNERPVQADAVAITGIHYSNTEGLKALDGSKYGSNHHGAEWKRVQNALWQDESRFAPIANRVYFYPSDSSLAAGESMVGRADRHEVSLANLYDADADPRGLWDAADDYNEVELAVVKAGFDGYKTAYMAVVLGTKPVPVGRSRASTRAPGLVSARADAKAARENYDDLNKQLRSAMSDTSKMEMALARAHRLIGEVSAMGDVEEMARDAKRDLAAARKEVDAQGRSALPEYDRAKDALAVLQRIGKTVAAKSAEANRMLVAMDRAAKRGNLADRTAQMEALLAAIEPAQEAFAAAAKIRDWRAGREHAIVKAYQKRTDTLNKLAAEGMPQGNTTWEADKPAREKALYRARRAFQDRMIDVRDIGDAISKAMGKELPDFLNLYREENLMHGKAEEGIRAFQEKFSDPLKEAIKASGVSNKDVSDYLWAKHAQERNERIAKVNPAMPDGGSGMTTAEAKQKLADFDARGLTPKMDAIAKRVQAIRHQTLDTLLRSGQITPEQHTTLSTMFKHYVPLRGNPKLEEGESRVGAGRGLDMRGKPVQRALGRSTEPSNILGELVGDAERAIVQGAKADVGRVLLRMALAFPNAGVWKVLPVTIEPKFSEATGEVYLAVVNGDPETTVIVKHNGKPYSVELVDPRLRDAVMNYGIEGLEMLPKLLGWANRWLSATMTRFNPAFTAVNMLRDALQGSIAVASELGGDALKGTAKHYFPAMGAMWNAANGGGDSKVADAVKTMVDWAREFAEAGGKTGYATMTDPETMQQRIENEMAGIGELIRDRKPVAALGQALQRSIIVQGVERANDAVENAMRLAVYVQMRKTGSSQAKAAQYAKDVTINFNRRGTATGALNSLYLFFNASVQGGHRTLKLLSDKRVMAGLAGLGAAQGALALSVGMMKYKDDDETLWEQIPDYVRERAFVIPLGFKDDGDPLYAAIPMPYGFNLFTSVGGYPALAASPTWRARQEHGVAATFVNTTARSAIDAFSVMPLGEDGWFLPTLMRMQSNFAANKDDFGNSIRSTQAQRSDMPKSSAGKADTPEAYRAIATALNRIGGGDEVTKPVKWLDYAPEDIEYMMGQVTGGLGGTLQQTYRAASRMSAGLDVSPGDIPIVSRLLGSQRRERVTTGMYYDASAKMDKGLEKLRMSFTEDGVDGFEKAKADLGPAFDGVVIARYRTSSREQGYRRGQLRVDADTGRPTLVAMPGSVFASYKDVKKTADDYGSEIRATYGSDIGSGDRMRGVDALQVSRADEMRAFLKRWNEATR